MRITMSIVFSRILILCFMLSAFSAAAQETPLSGVLISPEDNAAQLKIDENWQELEKVAAKWALTEGSSWQPWYYHGLALLRLGKNEDALQSLDLASRLAGEQNDQLALLLGDAYTETQQWQSAERIYRELLSRYQNNPVLWEKLHHVMEQYLLSEPPNAEEVRQNLIEISGKLLMFSSHIKDDTLWLRYASLLDEAGRKDEARSAYNQFLLLNPDDLAVLEWIFRYDSENADTAVLPETIARLRRVSKDNPLLHAYLGQQAMAAGNQREARRHYKIISENNNYPYQQAQALSGLGDLAGGAKRGEALDYYKQAINAAPSYLYAWERIIVILRAGKQNALAQRYFNRFRKVQKIVETGAPVPRGILHDI